MSLSLLTIAQGYGGLLVNTAENPRDDGSVVPQFRHIKTLLVGRL